MKLEYMILYRIFKKKIRLVMKSITLVPCEFVLNIMLYLSFNSP